MPTVLVVDDSPMDRKIAGEFVEEQDLTPIFAENGDEALETLARERPDIVLTDLLMPGLDGLELVKRIRRDYPRIPVVLMTGYGSEDTAAAALKAGASSYVPKSDLKRELGEALRTVMAAVETQQQREMVRGFLRESDSEYELGCEDPESSIALVAHLQEELAQFSRTDEAELFQVGTALAEALTNAIDHGSLELDSTLRQTDDYAYGKLRELRRTQKPYCDRRIQVIVQLTPTKATYVVRDEGGGFDPSTLPDPTNPENLLRPSGRGIMLIHTFMDVVSFNKKGNEITMVKNLE